MKPIRTLAMAVALTTSCIDTGQERVTMPLRLAGTPPTAPSAALNGWSVELARADLAFGPLYLCAGYQRFFRHVDEPMRVMAALLRQGADATGIRDWYAARDGRAPAVADGTAPAR